MGRVLLAHTLSVAPGDSRHGLLVYRAIDPNTKRFKVDVQLVLPSGDVVRFSAPYRRIKDEQD